MRHEEHSEDCNCEKCYTEYLLSKSKFDNIAVEDTQGLIRKDLLLESDTTNDGPNRELEIKYGFDPNFCYHCRKHYSDSQIKKHNFTKCMERNQ